MSKYTVIVGNLGTVHEDNARHLALIAFREWQLMSKAKFGRGAGEPVTLMEDGEPIKEYEPETPPEMRLRLTVDVAYTLNGESAEHLKQRLIDAMQNEIDNGALTGDTEAEVDTTFVTVTEVS